jgi:iron complex outermembrane recepter protein
MKKVLFILLAIATMQLANASKKNIETSSQATTITGKITDKNTGEALAGVEVHLLDTEFTVYTDFEGKFEFKNIQAGAHAIKAEYISYQLQVENVYADSKNTNTVSLKLKSIQE